MLEGRLLARLRGPLTGVARQAGGGAAWLGPRGEAHLEKVPCPCRRAVVTRLGLTRLGKPEIDWLTSCRERAHVSYQ